MKSRARRMLSAMLGLASLSAILALDACASVGVPDLKKETGFIYGKGSGPSKEEAEEAARVDLIRAALAGPTAREDMAGFALTPEMAASIKLPALKPFRLDTTKTGVSVVYRMPSPEWDRLEGARRAGVRAEIGPAFASLRTGEGQSLDRRIAEAGRLLSRLSREGVAETLTETESGPTLMGRAIEDYCAEQVAGASFSVAPASGLVDDGTSFEVSLAAADGSPLAGTPISILWKTAAGEALAKAAATTTDSRGRATMAFPKGEVTGGVRELELSLATAFSAKSPDLAFIGKLDAGTARDFAYFHFDDIKKAFFDEAKIPGGAFTAGAVKQDRRAERKEAPRPASVASFYMDRNLVTNALYRAFLADTKAPASAYPAYWDNPDYNGPDQPVIGVSLEDAKRFASWVSERLDCKKRLPTEEEWEKAARGGAEGIYPWGDQAPGDSVRANYNGNGRFDGTSPVASFESGKNGYGLYDMAGNVWEWTSSSAAADAAGAAIVKGGSWMDGPNELRVSNRRELDPTERFSDVGFRLVREVSND